MVGKPTRRNLAGGLLPMTIGVVGPSGTGKSTLAKKIARMITRSDHSPNVLLVDADIFGRGLTALIEGPEEIQCKHLHDVIAGKNTAMSPVELPESCIGPGEWPSLPEDGRVFFIPSSRAGTPRSPVVDAGPDFSEFKRLLVDAITSASHSGRAEAIVIDTAPIPELCGAILASMCDLIILVGDQDHGEEVIREHLRRLEGFLQESDERLKEIPIEIVFNQMDSEFVKAQAGQLPAKFHVLPAVNGLGDDVAENVDFERRILDIVGPFFSREHPGLVPSWCAPLPGEWRKVANALGESSKADHSFLDLFPKIAPPFLRRAAFAFGVGIPAVACLFLTSSISNSSSASLASDSSLKYFGLAIGVCFLLLAVFQLVRTSVECRACVVAASRLAAKDFNWVLSRLRLEPKHNHEGASKRRKKLTGHKLNKLHRVFDSLGHSIHERGKFR